MGDLTQPDNCPLPAIRILTRLHILVVMQELKRGVTGNARNCRLLASLSLTGLRITSFTAGVRSKRRDLGAPETSVSQPGLSPWLTDSLTDLGY